MKIQSRSRPIQFPAKAASHAPAFARTVRHSSEEVVVHRKVLLIREDSDSRQGMGRLLRAGLVKIQNFLRIEIDHLADKGFKPTQITTTEIALCAAVGGLIFALPTAKALLIAMPVVFAARIVLDIMDGLMAHEHRQLTSYGKFLNELAYVSDAFLYLPLMFIPGAPAMPILAGVGVSLGAEAVGSAGFLFGGRRRNDGPLSKFTRGVIVSATALAVGMGWLSATAFGPVMWAIAGLAGLTILNRARKLVSGRRISECIVDKEQRNELLLNAMKRAAREVRQRQNKPVHYLDLFARSGAFSVRLVEDFVVESGGDYKRSGTPDRGGFGSIRLCTQKKEEWERLRDLLHERDVRKLVESFTHEGPFANVAAISPDTNLVNLNTLFDVFPEDEEQLSRQLKELHDRLPPGAFVVYSGILSAPPGFYIRHNLDRLTLAGKHPGDIRVPRTPYRRIGTLMQAAGFKILKVDATDNGTFSVGLVQKEEL